MQAVTHRLLGGVLENILEQWWEGGGQWDSEQKHMGMGVRVGMNGLAVESPMGVRVAWGRHCIVRASKCYFPVGVEAGHLPSAPSFGNHCKSLPSQC